MRACLPLLAAGLLAAADAPEPLPTLPPAGRPLQFAATSGSGGGQAAPDHRRLAEDLQALRRAVERVETVLRQDGAAPPAHAPVHGEADGHGDAAGHGGGDHGGGRAAGTPLASPQFGVDRLSLRPVGDGEGLVSAALEGEPAEAVAKELCTLAGVRLDLRDVSGLRRPVSLHVHDLPWRDALDRVLGQIGMSWSEEESGHTRRAVVKEGAGEASAGERAASRALGRAAAAPTGAAAAEARYLIANRALAACHAIEAMRGFNEVAETFAEDRDPGVREWVQRAVRGVGEAMFQLKQFREARSVFRNYISRASIEDRELPPVYLRAAEAGRRLGIDRNDPVALDEAVEDLHALLERFAGREGGDPPEVALGRLMIGGLLFDVQRWQEAETQLKLYRAAAGNRPLDQVDWWIAECALRLGRADEAREGFERLYAAWQAGRADGLAPLTVYATAAYRIGFCHLRVVEPRYVHALFAFQRAVRDFPRAELDPEVAVGMAACYAQIEREDKAVEQLLAMLKADGPGGGRQRLDLLVGELMARLGDQAGPVRARAYFYIAQAAFRRAERERGERTAVAAQAVGYYERVLAERPPAELRDAARLGLARAALLAGNEERGLAELRRLRTDPALLPRDRAYADRLLGEHYQAKGMLREAVRAFRGETEGL